MLGWLTAIGALVAAGVALWQLQLQRIQLTAQTRVQEREQANRVAVFWELKINPRELLVPDAYAGGQRMLVVANNSNRPIRNVAAKLELRLTERDAESKKPVEVGTEPARLADAGAELRPYPGRKQDSFMATGGPTVSLIRAGAKGAFIWLPPATQKPVSQWLVQWVHFTDDADLHWEVDNTLHLQKLKRRDW